MLVAQGAAVVAPTSEEIVARVRRLIERPAEAEAIRTNARRLYKPATQTIVADILKAIEA